MDSSFIPTYEDVPPDPTRSQSTQGRRPLLEILRHRHSSVYARPQKRLVLLPRLDSYTLRSLWKSRFGEGTMQYELKLQRAIAGVRIAIFPNISMLPQPLFLIAAMRWRRWTSTSLKKTRSLEALMVLLRKKKWRKEVPVLRRRPCRRLEVAV